MHKPPSMTPWGHADICTQIAGGIFSVSTPGHGGIWISPERRAQMPDDLRGYRTYAGLNWFEEDCDWAVVALSFPEHFDGRSLHYAILTARHEHSGLAKQINLDAYLETPTGKRAAAKGAEWFIANSRMFEFGTRFSGASGCGGELRRVDGLERRAYRCKETPSLKEPFTLEQAAASGLHILP